MPRKKKLPEELQKEFKLFEANDVAKYGIMSVAGNALAPTAYKALMVLIWKCNQATPGKFDEITMSITELGEMLGYSKDKNCNFSHNVKRVCDVVESIMSRPLSIHDAEKNERVSFVWIQYAKARYKEDTIHVRFGIGLQMHFGQELQKNFTVVKLKYLNRLTTTAAVILYPFFCRYLGLGTFNYSYQDMSQLLTGVKEYEYRRLKGNFLKPAVQAINRLSDLHVEFKEIKNGTSVTALTFTVRKEPAEDEYKHFIDYNHVKFDEVEIMPYNDAWMSAYNYDMATQTYRRRDGVCESSMY